MKNLGIQLHQFVHNTPLDEQERNLLNQKLDLTLKNNSGENKPFRLKLGDKVEDFFMYTPARYMGIVIDLYKENGYNKVVTDSIEKPFHREQDLRKI